MKKHIFIIISALLCVSSVFAENDIISDMPEANFETDKVIAVPNGPAYIKNLSRKMKSPGYWTAKIKNPDSIILTQDQIQQYNQTIADKNVYITDIFKYPKSIRTKSFQKQLDNTFALFKREQYLDSCLNPVQEETFNKIRENSKCKISSKNLSLKTRFAITVNYTDVRILPTDDGFISNKETFDIDRAQVAGLDIGEPLVLISKSRDRKWSYVISTHSEGWVKTKDIVSAEEKDILNWVNSKDFVVITETKADVFFDKNKHDYYDYVRMGAKFPVISSDKSGFCIKIPRVNKANKLYFSKAYIDILSANKGFLPYTQRNVINTAFKHLNSPYSWGGMEGEQDCSTFIRQIFNCFGFKLPRNSSSQIKCGNHPKKINADDSVPERKLKITNNAKEGLSLLFLPGHIMLYIGQEKGVPYVIHALWGTETYNEKNEKAISFINKILVSDLSIGSEKPKGSLLERITDFSVLN